MSVLHYSTLVLHETSHTLFLGWLQFVEKMPPKKDKGPVDVPVVPVEKKDDLPDVLMKHYVEHRHQSGADLFEFTHGKYEEWMDYFGFNLENELRWQQEHKAKSLHGTKTRSMAGTLRKTVGQSHDLPSPTKTHQGTTAANATSDANGAAPSKDSIDTLRTAVLADDAGVETPKLRAGYAAVDEKALTLGPCTGASVDEIAKQLGAPYERATWRQSTSLCCHHRVRAVFRWVCDNFKVVPPSSQPTVPGVQVGSVTLPVPGTESTGAKAPKGKGAKAPPSPQQQSAPTKVVENDPIGKKVEAALATRTADAETLAHVVSSLLDKMDVRCDAVKGTLKGILDNLGKPLGALPWGWNVAYVPIEASEDESAAEKWNPDSGLPEDFSHRRSYDYGTSQRVAPKTQRFVFDCALAMAYVGPRAGLGGPASNDPPAGKAEGNKKENKKEAQQTPRGGRGGDPAASLDATVVAPSVPTTLFSQPPDYSPHFEPFYFYTDPREFAALHFPEDSTNQILAKPIGRTSWEIYPRLSHDFYLNKLDLDSHRRRAWLTVKRTPLYISFLLNDTRHVDLILAVYKGTAASVDENSTPLDSKFVWSTREEKEGRQTFSVMLPDVGMYTMMLGARHVDPDTDWAAAPSYRLVCQYQTQVNFVPTNETMFPKQHLTPAVCKWLGPIGHKLVVGANQLAIVPTNPRVHAVAVVNKVYKPVAKVIEKPNSLGGGILAGTANESSPTKPPSHPNTPGEGAKRPGKGGKVDPGKDTNPAASKNPQPEEPVIERTEVHLLPLNTEKGVFEGMVTLEIGLVEFWVLLDPIRQSVVKAGNTTTLGDPMALFGKYLGSSPKYQLPPPKDGGEGHRSRTPNGTRTGNSPLPPQIPTGFHLQASPGASTAADGQDGQNSPRAGGASSTAENLGVFIPFVTQIHCVKRIPAKEMNVNEGEPLVKPAILNWQEDRPFIFRLLNGTSVDGRKWDDEAGKAAFLSKPLHQVGGYFEAAATKSPNKTGTAAANKSGTQKSHFE